MLRDPLQIDAARRQLIALERYESSFNAMVEADMASELYAATNGSLEEIRAAASIDARNLLFNTTQLLLAHSNLTARLWQRQMARQRAGSVKVANAEIAGLRQDHARAIERLRDRCSSLLSKRSP